MKILIRADGSEQLGNGHIFRMKALSDQLQEMKLEHAFAIRMDDYWVSNFRNEGREVHKLSSQPDDKVSELSGLISSLKITHLIYDTRNDLTKEDLKLIKKQTGVRLTVNDSPEETRLVADVNLYPPLPQIKDWDWSGFEGSVILAGWEFVLLRKEFLLKNKLKVSNIKPQSVLLSFGSTDPFCITERVLDLLALNKELLIGMKYFILIGPQFKRTEKIRELISGLNLPAEIIIAPENIVDLYRSMDMAIIAFGVTAYELVVCEVPFLSVSISADHERSASFFESCGLSASLGIFDELHKNIPSKLTAFIETYFSKIAILKKFNSENEISNYKKIIYAIIN